MFPHGLKTNIAIHLAVLLLLAMVLVNVVLITTTREDLLRFELDKGSLLISMIENTPGFGKEPYFSPEMMGSENGVEAILKTASIPCVLILDKNLNRVYSGGRNCTLKGELHRLTRQSIRSGRRQTGLFGETWGVLWKQAQYAILSAPLIREGKIVAGAGVLLPLEGIYKTLRRSQQILFIYIIANAVVMTLIGLYALSRVVVNPLVRLVNRAEEYQENEELFFLYEKEGNEFSKLSGSLNRMLQRIREDKEKLRSTVQSLEKVNIELELAQKDVIRAEKLASVGRLSSGIAHEIGNPIGIVLGYLELLKQKDIDEAEKIEFIGRAEKEINRINTIIGQLLDFSKTSKVGPEVISVHAIIDDIVKVFKVQPMMKQIEIRKSLAAEADNVLADPDQLRQVFLNLLINSADAISTAETSTGNEIEIDTKIAADVDPVTGKSRPKLEIRIRDNGPGISPENIDNIFDPFFTTKETGMGTGLGLWVSFIMIDGIDGTITADSEPNTGTTVTIYLPLYTETARQKPPGGH